MKVCKSQFRDLFEVLGLPADFDLIQGGLRAHIILVMKHVFELRTMPAKTNGP